VRLLRRRPKVFDIQVQDLVLRITAPDDLAEESRAAALSFWEQLQSYGLRHPDFNSSKRPLRQVAADAPEIVKEVVSTSSAAGSAGSWDSRSTMSRSRATATTTSGRRSG
jgi:ApbE superfamily uncharacterized protein (UPF0280 family)